MHSIYFFSSDEEELAIIRQVIDYDESEGVHHQAPKTKDEILPQVCLTRSILETMQSICSTIAVCWYYSCYSPWK